MTTFERASKMGIEVEKEWIATSDARTRDSHSELDGIRVPWDEKFPNGLECPGDPKGAPEEVYNCRCSMARVPLGEAPATGNTVESYEEWKQQKIQEENLFTKRNTSHVKIDGNNINSKLAKNTENQLYISNKLKGITEKEIKEMDSIIGESLKIVNTSNNSNIPKFIITEEDEFNADGKYLALKNVVLLKRNSFISYVQEDYLMPADKRMVTIHELFHWDVAEEFKKETEKNITKRNLKVYNTFKQNYGKRIMNVNDDIDPVKLSQYSKHCMMAGNWSEVGTEIRTYIALKGEKP